MDRCRPPFALSVIERIKHLFSVPGVCFVLVTHLPQLEQVVQGAYGTTVDAHTYLEKFYQVRVTLPEKRDQRGTQCRTYIAYLWRALGINFPEARIGELVQQELLALAETYNLSLRRMERVMTHVALVCAATGPNQIIIPPLVAGLCVMRQVNPALYRKAGRKELTWEEARDFLQPTEGQGVQEWTSGWWKYATGEEVSDDEIGEHERVLIRYAFRDPKDLIPFMANYIDQLAQRRGPPEDQ